uniref:Zn(2)-C6 fungal-type domain-containing protein n=1 Tax=Fusarium oxysporum (strain Fo5176) TaxID=660025 RepID=A0A0D2XEX3_FUSOF
MAENPSPDERVAIDDLTPEEANRIIHSHRKVRYGTACWPCRQRKVKCDNKQPCENCVKREHPRLCSYKPNRSSTSKPSGSGAPSEASQGIANRKRTLSFSEAPRDEGVRKVERQDSWPRTLASIDEPEVAADRYLGQNSIPALLREQSSPVHKGEGLDIRQDMRSILGLDTSAPFPLMSSHHLQKLTQDISTELPSDREVMKPSFDSIQALLLTCFVLLNDMKAEASWALMGLTCRLAQSLGLHRTLRNESRDCTPPNTQSKEMVRRRLWWSVVWHDTLTSLSFDRSPMTNFPCCPIPVMAPTPNGNYSYLETMYHLMEIISRRLNPDDMMSASYAQIIDDCEAVETLRSRTAPQLRNKEICKTALDRLQHFAIRLHTSFVISVACRPALRKDSEFEPEQRKTLADRCKDNLTETVRMFLAMHQLSSIPTRSWAFTYHGLSSALLLGILCETKTDPEVRQLQGDLIAALSATAAKDVSSPEPHVMTTDKDIELSGPLYRALTALKNIYDHGSIVPSHLKKEGDASAAGSGSRTPLNPFGNPGQLPGNGNSMFRNVSQSADPREDAALAMAEMQNGGASIQDFPGLAYGQQMPNGNLNLDSMNAMNVDPTQYMAPMDLYESIWGESPDPWNTGMDSLNFDFLAQPPPGQPQQQFYF